MHRLRFQLGQLAAGGALGGGERAELVKEGGLLPWLRARQGHSRQGHSRLALGVLGMVGG